MADPTEHVWGITAAGILSRIGTQVADVSDETSASLGLLITEAAAEVNSYLTQYAGVTPEAVAAEAAADPDGESARVARLMSSAIFYRVAGVWLLPRKPDTASTYLDLADEKEKSLRIRIPAARVALQPQTGPDPPAGRVEAPTSWVDAVPDGEAFG